MTKSLRGSSLPQARSYHHNHYHLHNQRAASLENAHHHHRRQTTDQDETDSSPTTESAASSTSVPTNKVVVQTVSVVQIVDASGVPIEIHTVFDPPATVSSDDSSTPSATPSSSDGFGLSALALPSPSSTDGEVSSAESPSSSSDESSLSSTAATVPETTPAPADSSTGQDVYLTPDPVTTPPASTVAPSLYPSLGASVNSTIRELNLRGLTRTTGDGNETDGGAGLGGGSGQPTSTSTSSSNDSSSDTSTPSTGTVVGSVVGSVAGVAFLVLLAFLALRWKKQSGGRFRLSDNNANGNRGILNGSGAPDGGNSGGMTQRSLPLGTAAVAGAAGAAAAAKPPSRRASEPSETGERGFVRVAGRKLPSVLQSGGDGYTDPREGAAANDDDESVFFRDSQAFFDPNATGTPRLALGSPMRPVSGVVTMQPSPARTPVTESAPFSAPPDGAHSPLEPPTRDPIGRTLRSQDGSRGSRGSASRFTEDM
ncbi:hypothetical protein CTRI78_v000938 [Colletotrichum trifolii]|uniref:Uncharacterized protein n=1 Tax=Colletotrichum trifolii TaxID=5466 RepID=A0A4R8RXD9_COLTR|nr:hypothetical protein CTRI78_v000938 [Colletotrichum trifolii]